MKHENTIPLINMTTVLSKLVHFCKIAGGEPNTHPRASEWVTQKFPDGEGSDTGSRMCFCAPKDQSACGTGSNSPVLWGRGYQVRLGRRGHVV